MVLALGTELEQDTKTCILWTGTTQKGDRNGKRGGFQCCGQEGPQTRRQKKGRTPSTAMGRPGLAVGEQVQRPCGKGLLDVSARLESRTEGQQRASGMQFSDKSSRQTVREGKTILF